MYQNQHHKYVFHKVGLLLYENQEQPCFMLCAFHEEKGREEATSDTCTFLQLMYTNIVPVTENTLKKHTEYQRE